MSDFYTSETDAQLAKDIVSQSADIYIMPKHPMTTTETGVMNKAVPAATVITPAVVPAPAWVVDELIGNVVVLQDDDGGAREFVIADNDATSFTINLTSDVHGNDHSADYTDAATFAFWIWDAEEFLGWTEGADEFTDEDENKQFKRGVPRELVREDLLENTVTLATVVRTPGQGNLEMAGNLDDANSNATYHVLTKGSNPPGRPYFYLILKNTNVNGDAQQLRLYKTQCRTNGARTIGGGDEYESLPLLFTANVDTLRGDEITGDEHAGYNISNKYCVRIAK
jgi:hypothetical protein